MIYDASWSPVDLKLMIYFLVTKAMPMGHAVAGEELCSGEHNAALHHHAGKVQHLRSCHFGIWEILLFSVCY